MFEYIGILALFEDVIYGLIVEILSSLILFAMAQRLIKKTFFWSYQRCIHAKVLNNFPKVAN